MIKTKFIMLLFAIILIGTKSYAQDPYVDANQLPNQSIQGSGDVGGNVVNVDLFTGITSMNIPIYNRSIEGIDVSVSLDYSANGVPVDQTASSVGLGWNLSAGGYIEREVKGMEDEFMYTADSTNPLAASGSVVSGGLISWLPSVITYQMKGALIASTPAGKYETEHDCFTAVFGGRSVKFAFDNAGNVFTSPHTSLSIQMIVDGVTYTQNLPANIDQTQNDHVLTFKIKDEKGDCFYFERGDYEIKPNPSILSAWATSGNYYPTNKWVLTKIVTATGQVVTYNYTSYPLNYPQYNLETMQEMLISGSYNFVSDNASVVNWNGYVSHISSIQYPDGITVTFNLSDITSRSDVEGLPYLQSIKISNGYDPTVTNSVTYQLNQAYFNSIPTPGYPDLAGPEAPLSTSYSAYTADIQAAYSLYTADAHNKLNLGLRLKLNSITKIGNDGSTEPYYSFGYNSTMLPARLSPAQDWYGYYNGATPVVTLYPAVPLHTNDGGSVGIDKTPQISYLQACILNTITNGKGGEIDIAYQSPPSLSYSILAMTDMDEDLNAPDGLIINSITYKDGFNNDNNSQTNYTFSNGYTFYPGAYYWYPTVYSIATSAMWYRNLTNHMVTPMDFFNGSNHGYGHVEVTKNGFGGQLLSTTSYNYSNIISPLGQINLIDDQSSTLNHTFPRVSMDQPQMGLLLSSNDYGNNPSSGIPMKTTTYTYTNHSYPTLLNTVNFVYPATSLTPEPTLLPTVTPTYASRVYHVFESEVPNVTSVTETSWLGSGIMTNVTNNTYDLHDQLKATSNIDSKGALWTHYFFHNYDYSFTGFTPGSAAETAGYNAINAMTNDGLLVVIADEKRKNMNWALDPTHDSIISFSQWMPNYASGKTSIAYTANTTISTPIPTAQFHASISGDFFTDNSFYNYDGNVSNINSITAYDDHNNVLETYNSVSKKYSCALWDTRIGRKVASVSNARYADVFYTSFEGENGLNALGTADYNKGNWNFDPANIVLGSGSNNAITGRYFYNLTLHTFTTIHPLTHSTQYYFSFWWKGSRPSAHLSTGTGVLALQNQITVGDWTLTTGQVTGDGTSSFFLKSTSPSYIDEVRVIPANAAISTSTYEPFLGVNSMSDERNSIVYYEYDGMGRLKATRDINGNIISLNQNIVQGNDN